MVKIRIKVIHILRLSWVLYAVRILLVLSFERLGVRRYVRLWLILRGLKIGNLLEQVGWLQLFILAQNPIFNCNEITVVIRIMVVTKIIMAIRIIRAIKIIRAKIVKVNCQANIANFAGTGVKIAIRFPGIEN